MPTIMTHGLVGLAAGKLLATRPLPLKFWLLAGLCPMLPDADVLLRSFGIDDRHPFGHRGFTHSLFFAVLAGTLLVVLAFPERQRFSRGWWRLVAFFSAAIASHGVFDAMTGGGAGIAFFAPFDNSRYFLPWRPIKVSPTSLAAFISGRGVRVLLSEMFWIWLPGALLLWGRYRLLRHRNVILKRSEPCSRPDSVR